MKYAHTSHVAWRRVDGETYVIDLERKVMFGLNESGGEVWDHITAGRVIDGVDEPTAEFFADLEQHGLVERSEADAGDPVSLPAGAPPRIEWREEMTAFGYSCVNRPGQSPACTQAPNQ